MSDKEESSENYSSEEDIEKFPDEKEIDPRVINTITEMIDARGYILQENLLHHEVKRLMAQKLGYPDLHVIFAIDINASEEGTKFNVKMVNFCIEFIENHGLKHIIIVYQGKITSRVKDTIKNYMILRKVKIEIFTQKELRFNITKHRLVPLHELMSKSRGNDFKKQYGTKFNSMLLSDPVARFYGYEKGDVIIIHRKNGIVNYRIVI